MKAGFIGILILFSFNIVQACSCIGENTLSSDFDDADYVVRGKIIKVESVRLHELYKVKQEYWETNAPPMPFTKYTVHIKSVFKGKIKTHITYIYSSEWNSCGYSFKLGENYLIFGVNNMNFDGFQYVQNDSLGKDIFWTYACWSTSLYSRDDARALKNLSK